MKTDKTRKQSLILILSLTVPLALPAKGEPLRSKQLIAQGNITSQPAKKLSLEDIRKQIEARLSGIWKTLPGITSGSATFDFTLEKNGSMKYLKTINSSGLTSFDNSAKGTIKRVVPLPGLPSYLNINSINLRAHFESKPSQTVSLGFAPLSFTRTPPANGMVNKNTQAPKAPAKPQTMARQPIGVKPTSGQQNQTGLQTSVSPLTKNLSQANQIQSNQERIARAKKLLNLGVVSMNAGDYQTAIEKLEQALKLNPNYTLAKKNLAIAYNNTGLTQKGKPSEALKSFHRALYLDPNNSRTKSNLEALITIMGKNPGSYKDRLHLGDLSKNAGDKEGAKIEYLAAKSLKNTEEIQKRIMSLYGNVRPPAKPLPKAVNTPQAEKRPAHKHANPPKNSNIPKPKPKAKPIPKKPGKVVKKRTNPQKIKLNNVYMRLSNLEKAHLGRVFVNDDVLTRISRLEKKAFGAVQTGSPKRRLDALLLAQ